MKQAYLILSGLLLCGSHMIHAQVSISTDGSSPDSSAMLEIKSTERGFLPPRMDFNQRNAISNPAIGLLVFCTDCDELQMYTGSGWMGIPLVEASPAIVTNPATGRIWMDRNLGASRVATSESDALAFGDLYQWGRAADGHEKRNSATTATNATTAVPNLGNAWDGLFITEANSPGDWLIPGNDSLWQGVNGTNNPCPSGFRLPTFAEWKAERQSWISDDSAGAFASPLKLPRAGVRELPDGDVDDGAGASGTYWSSSMPTDGIFSTRIDFSTVNVQVQSVERAVGHSVRCIKD